MRVVGTADLCGSGRHSVFHTVLERWCAEVAAWVGNYGAVDSDTSMMASFVHSSEGSPCQACYHLGREPRAEPAWGTDLGRRCWGAVLLERDLGVQPEVS